MVSLILNICIMIINGIVFLLKWIWNGILIILNSIIELTSTNLKTEEGKRKFVKDIGYLILGILIVIIMVFLLKSCFVWN